MLSVLPDKLQGVFAKLRGQQRLTEENISDAVREVRLALLEADVQYGVVKDFVKRVKAKALGDAVLKAVEPGQQFVKLVHDELEALMGGEEAHLELNAGPAVVMLCGLQGAGKTTHCAKLAQFLKKQGQIKKPLLAACDLQRPAAISQLQTLGDQISVPVFTLDGEMDPVKVAEAALRQMQADAHDLLIVDTAGRLQVDDELMQQLERVKATLQPQETLFVANAATGQDAVNTAAEFDRRIGLTGHILTMLDGSARGGAAISIKEVTGKPLKFEGVGEKLGDLQVFNPSSMADRILGMGDIINLVRKAEEHIDQDEAKKLEKKLRKAAFTYDDYLQQMQMVKKMGSIKGLLGMLPGMNQMKGMDFDEKNLFKVEAIILSMTLDERQERVDLNMNRRKRIARGSGTDLAEVNKLVKSFKQAKQFFKRMPNMKQMEKMMGGLPWR
jgi:signal recognition particle subunit SRP54